MRVHASLPDISSSLTLFLLFLETVYFAVYFLQKSCDCLIHRNFRIHGYLSKDWSNESCRKMKEVFIYLGSILNVISCLCVVNC